jgi:hypothetical protein
VLQRHNLLLSPHKTPNNARCVENLTTVIGHVKDLVTGDELACTFASLNASTLKVY